MKKHIGLLLIVVLLVSSLPVFAAESKINAYSNLEKANPKERKLIIEARKKIVYGDQPWTVDGQVAIKNKDGKIEKIPEFKELFPNWDLEDLKDEEKIPYDTAWTIDGQVALRELDGTITKLPELSTLMLKRKYPDIVISSTTASFDGKVYLSKSSNAFYNFNASRNPVYSYATTLPKGSKVNIGYTNQDTNTDVGWIPNLTEYQTAVLYPIYNVRYSVRASTYDNPGWAYMCVHE